MKKMILHILKGLVLFSIYGTIYFVIESIYKGHPTNLIMFVVGGIIGFLIGLINNLFNMDTNFILQCFVGTMIVLLVECILGYKLNIIEHKMLWDYSNVPFNFVGGQICLPFAVIWFILSGICIIIDDYLRYIIFKEEKPYYVIFNKCFEYK